MRINALNYYTRRKIVFAVIALLALGAVGLINFMDDHIWADTPNMTRLRFTHATFCQRVSQAIEDSLGAGKADGGDCANFNLYVSTDDIENIQALNVTPPPGGFGNIDFETQSITIGGDWMIKLNKLTSLSITNMYVENISPLGNISGNLEQLNLSNNRITDVSPLIALKDKLVSLTLSGNQISNGLAELSTFTKLTTLRLANTGLYSLNDLLKPAELTIDYNQETGMPERFYDALTGEELSKIPRSSELAKHLEVLDISNNKDLSSEREDSYRTGMCDGNLAPLLNYPMSKIDTGYPDLAEDTNELILTELIAYGDNLNSDDVFCVTRLNNLQKLDVSSNHIDDFGPISGKTYRELKAYSQVYTREIDGLDYGPLPKLFTQVRQANYIPGVPGGSNDAVPRSSLELDNAQFNGDLVRFINAAIASRTNGTPQPATVRIPEGSGIFENSRLEVYFTGQVVTFNDSKLCNMVYQQGSSVSAYIGVDGSSNVEEPVVITNACEAAKKQIAMKAGGSQMFLRLELDSVRNGAPVDITGLEEFNNLQVLDLSNNGLTDLDTISHAYSLQQLMLNDNNLQSEDWQTIIANFTNLGLLYLNNNHMNEIPSSISNLNRLGGLYLVNNGISNVDSLAYASTLTVLDLSENSQITDFSGLVQDGSACKPQILKIENAGVTRLPNANKAEVMFANLLSLNLNGNLITDETIANLAVAPGLEELYLEHNRISDTSTFSGITTLKKLFLDNNQIENVTGLVALGRLTELHLNGNKISSVAGLNTLPSLVTLALKNQSLTGSLGDNSDTYVLPDLFSQATDMEFPRISGFQSSGDYSIENGSIDYFNMTATISDGSNPMIITIPDGSFAGTKLTVIYTGGTGGGNEWEFANTLIDNTRGGATITPTSTNTFTVSSDLTCMALLTQDNRTTWTRLASNPLTNSHEFNTNQITGAEIVIAYAGDVTADANVNVLDVRKIRRFILEKESATSLQEQLANVDGRNGINVMDVRALTKSIIRKGEINW